MRLGILALMWIHLLAWAGCEALPSHKLGSNQVEELENFKSVLYMKANNHGFWRKLLEENAEKHEETSVPVEIESKTEGGKEAEKLEGMEVKDVASAQNEQVRTQASTSSDEAKDESAVIETKVELKKEDEVKEEPKDGTIHEVKKEESVSEETRSDVVQQSSDEVENSKEIESHNAKETHAQSEDAQKEEENITLGTRSVIDTTENAAQASLPQVNTVQVQREELKPKESEQVQKQDEKPVEADSGIEIPLEKTDVEDQKDTSSPEMQEKKSGDVEGHISSDGVIEEKRDVSAEVNEEKEDASTEQAKTSPGETVTSGGDKQAEPTKEGDTKMLDSEAVESNGKQEEMKEDNAIKMVESEEAVSDRKEKEDGNTEIVQSKEEKEQSALDSNANVEKIDNPGSMENSEGDTGNTSDLKVEEEKTDNPGDRENSEGDTSNTSYLKVEEEKAEKHESSDDNTESKDKESESTDVEEALQAKADDETQAATQEVESQLEALKRDTVFDPTDDRRQERDPSEDEYDIIQELADLPTKFQETAGKVADHLRPDVQKWTDTSKEYFNLANQQITDSFSPLIGKQYAPFFASMISYGILLLPLIVVIVSFEHIKALLSLQKVLLFINIYLAAYFSTLWLASFIIGLEPMSFFYQNNLSSYLSLQLLQGLGYVVYLMLQTTNIIFSCTSDTSIGKLTAVFQWFVSVAIGLHYYVTVFHPAVASKPPHTSWKFYAIYSVLFFILCLSARIRWVKKHYVSLGNDITNKKS